MIYISTGGFSDQTASKTSEILLENGIENIELSGGKFDENFLPNLRKLKGKANFQIHNYFPPPEIPFVFNLASLNNDISKQSIEHAHLAIQLAVELGQSVYSFHAGYLLDPKVSELGKRMSNRKINERKIAIEVFLERVNDLADYAARLGADLLVENNVLSNQNLKEFGLNPFIMSTVDECVYIMEKTPNNVNMLVDVAHLKVSANTLDYNPLDLFRLCDPWIKAYHFSDNNGSSDSNDIFDDDTWFWPYVKPHLDYYSIEVYNVNPKKLKKLLILVSQKINYKDGF